MNRIAGSATIVAVAFVSLVLGTSAADAGGEPPIQCEVRFSADAVPFGALQFEVDYSAADGSFSDTGINVQCTNQLGEGLLAARDDDGAQVLHSAQILLEDHTTAADVVSCIFDAYSEPTAADFVVTEIDSAPAETNGILSNVCGAPVTGMTPPYARDALVIVRKAVGMAVICQDCECDLNNSGMVLGSDSLIALKAAVGDPATVLNCPACVGSTTTSAVSAAVSVSVEVVSCSAVCPFEPDLSCGTGTKSSLKISNNLVDDGKDSLKWKLAGGPLTVQADLGDPVTSTDYTLCIYDTTAGAYQLVSETVVTDGPLWTSKDPKGFLYKDTDLDGSSDGVAKLQLKTGDAGKSKFSLLAKQSSAQIPVPADGSSMFDLDPRVVVQLRNSASPDCWTSEFTAASANTPTKFSAKAP